MNILIWILIIAFVAVIAVLIVYGNNKTDITRYDLKSQSIKSKVKIMQLSDLHSKPSGIIMNHVKAESPDIICVTGDFINDKCKNKGKMLSYAKELCAIAPTIYITGNHERRLDNFDSLMSELSQAGFTVLLNEKVDIDGISFLGLDENQANFEDYKARKNGTFKYKDMKPYFDMLAGDNYKIVLSHFPENFCVVEEMNYSQYDFDLQLSGHAHGGQWVLPLIGPLFSPGQGILPKYTKGQHGERPKLIISRGIGNAEFPIRFLNHPEINVISVEPENHIE